jgi:uncharacterized protein (TIGR04222 family)
MDILINNPLAQMHGPNFLFLYGIVIGITLTSCQIVLQGNIFPSASTSEIPSQPDSYEIAYLRDGEQGVAKLVCWELQQKGLIQVKEKHLERTASDLNVFNLTPLEKTVFDWLEYPRNLSNFRYDYSLKQAIAEHCQGYQQSLETAGYFNPKAKSYLVGGIGGLIILSLGSYKLMVATFQGHHNVLFLMMMAIAATIWLGYLTSPLGSRLTAKGRLYLNNIQTAFSGLETNLKAPPTEPDANSALAIAIGDQVKIRESEYYQDFVNFFIPPFTYTSSSSGTGCSSSSCGSSCSSSSCGGGCGGGCGGCGG